MTAAVIAYQGAGPFIGVTGQSAPGGHSMKRTITRATAALLALFLADASSAAALPPLGDCRILWLSPLHHREVFPHGNRIRLWRDVRSTQPIFACKIRSNSKTARVSGQEHSHQACDK